jgi:hypothetical protein
MLALGVPDKNLAFEDTWRISLGDYSAAVGEPHPEILNCATGKT